VVGGLHLPVHAAGTPLIPQAVLGNPHPPWQPISGREFFTLLAGNSGAGPGTMEHDLFAGLDAR